MHDVAATAIGIGSCWAWGASFAKLGSVVMLLLDLSSVPRDIMQLPCLGGGGQVWVASLSVALTGWSYCRLWLLPSKVLQSVIPETCLNSSTTCSITGLPPERGVLVVVVTVSWLLSALGFISSILGTDKSGKSVICEIMSIRGQ
jgi:hypothetical protein